MGFYEIKNLLTRNITLDYDKAIPTNANARGIPIPLKGKETNCSQCKECEVICPTKAISIQSDKEIQFDYGLCLQCGICTDICPSKVLENSGFVYVMSFYKEELKINYKEGDFIPQEFPISANVMKFQKLTGKKGFTYREVAAAGNNTVECELNASFNNVFDSEGMQARSVASPKHADAIVFSGPVSKNMAEPLAIAWDCMPEPKALIANGTEAISGGLFQQGSLPKTPDLYIGGDPPRPDVMINAYRMLMGVFKYSFQKALKNFIQGEKK